MSDSLPKGSPHSRECGVVNLDKSENVGTHWICYYKQNDNAFIFDSFGGEPPTELIRYLKHVKIYYNDDRIQDFDQIICGHVCITMLRILNKIPNIKLKDFSSLQRDFGFETTSSRGYYLSKIHRSESILQHVSVSECNYLQQYYISR